MPRRGPKPAFNEAERLDHSDRGHFLRESASTLNVRADLDRRWHSVNRDCYSAGYLDRLLPILDLDGPGFPSLNGGLEQGADLTAEQQHDDGNAHRPCERADERRDELSPGHDAADPRSAVGRALVPSREPGFE